MGEGVGIIQRRTAGEWGILGLACPTCRAPFEDAGVSALACTGCRTTWPVVCGIPDLRTLGDPYLSIADDIAAAERLAALGDGADFAARHAAYYQGNAKVSPAQVARFTHGVLAAGDRAVATLETWRELGGELPPGRAVLDVGCGTAPLGVAMARLGHRVLGLDAGLRWLVLARARAAGHGVDLPVVCANAEQLPLVDARLHAVVGESVLENVVDADAAIAEGRRVLGEAGVLALTTPNRRSLGPDPHLGVLAGGWRSTASLQALAARTGQVMPRRRLFAPGELVDALRAGGFTAVRLALPRVAAAQRAGVSPLVNLAIDGYHLARRVPVVRSLLQQVAPTIAVVARRP